MTDLERLFRRLVRNLADTEPARLHQPLALADLYQSIVPYRSNRRSLQLESSEDYELVLLRLAAGEGGFVRTEPEAARKRFAEEIASTNPDLTLLRRTENVFLTLRSEPLAYALGPEPGPPHPPSLELPEPAQPDEILQLPELAPSAAEEQSPRCRYCGGALPEHRAVTFCPHCGQRQGPATCPACHNEVEPGWQHCVSCGAALPHG
ncbi:MAG: zinc ribbon domain-containing protein [Gemmatimonadales bacterium]